MSNYTTIRILKADREALKIIGERANPGRGLTLSLLLRLGIRALDGMDPDAVKALAVSEVFERRQDAESSESAA